MVNYGEHPERKQPVTTWSQAGDTWGHLGCDEDEKPGSNSGYQGIGCGGVLGIFGVGSYILYEVISNWSRVCFDVNKFLDGVVDKF